MRFVMAVLFYGLVGTPAHAVDFSGMELRSISIEQFAKDWAPQIAAVENIGVQAGYKIRNRHEFLIAMADAFPACETKFGKEFIYSGIIEDETNVKNKKTEIICAKNGPSKLTARDREFKFVVYELTAPLRQLERLKAKCVENTRYLGARAWYESYRFSQMVDKILNQNKSK